MSLERFRRMRIVVLNQRSTAYQATRAMTDNHIGAALASQPPEIAGIVTDRGLALAVLGGINEICPQLPEDRKALFASAG